MGYFLCRGENVLVIQNPGVRYGIANGTRGVVMGLQFPRNTTYEELYTNTTTTGAHLGNVWYPGNAAAQVHHRKDETPAALRSDVQRHTKKTPASSSSYDLTSDSQKKKQNPANVSSRIENLQDRHGRTEMHFIKAHDFRATQHDQRQRTNTAKARGDRYI